MAKKTMDIINLILGSENDIQRGLYEKYFIEGLTVRKIRVLGYSNFHFDKYLLLRKQVPLLLLGLFNGDFDNVSDKENFDNFLKRLISLFSYTVFPDKFKKSKILKSVIMEWNEMGMPMSELLTYVGYVFYVKTMPITFNYIDLKNGTSHWTEEAISTFELYNYTMKTWKSLNLLIEYKKESFNYYNLWKYRSFKSFIVSFFLYLFSVYEEYLNDENFIMIDNFKNGILFRIISNTFKYKHYLTDDYLLEQFSEHTKKIKLRQNIQNKLFLKIKSDVLLSSTILYVYERKIKEQANKFVNKK